jgi:hypothetical protein
MRFPRSSYVIILVAFAAATVRAQEATQVCSDGRTIKIASQWDQLTTNMPESDAAAQPLHYSISSTQGVKGAWMEVWDRPKRLSRTAVPVEREGEAGCVGCEDAEQTPEDLYISIFDPEVVLFCIDYCSGPIAPGEYVSQVLAGKKPSEDSDESLEPAYLMEDPELNGPPIRVVEGTEDTTVVLSGENLISSSRVYFMIGEDASPESKPSRNYLYSRTIDLRHVEVTMPSDLADKPGLFMAYAKDSWERRPVVEATTGQKIIVVSKDGPVVDSVKPRALSCCSSDASLVVRGSGFTQHSKVQFGDDISLGEEVRFVSPTELHIVIPADRLTDSSGRYARATPVMLSVINAPLHFSAPVAIVVVPSAKFKPQPLTAAINAIAPYPVPMMDYHSPRFIILEVKGDNFRPNDVVAYGNGERTRLKTQYLSSHHLRAWLPRDLWRKHLLSFRLVVQTPTGFCEAEAFEKWLE